MVMYRAAAAQAIRVSGIRPASLQLDIRPVADPQNDEREIAAVIVLSDAGVTSGMAQLFERFLATMFCVLSSASFSAALSFAVYQRQPPGGDPSEGGSWPPVRWAHWRALFCNMPSSFPKSFVEDAGFFGFSTHDSELARNAMKAASRVRFGVDEKLIVSKLSRAATDDDVLQVVAQSGIGIGADLFSRCEDNYGFREHLYLHPIPVHLKAVTSAPLVGPPVDIGQRPDGDVGLKPKRRLERFESDSKGLCSLCQGAGMFRHSVRIGGKRIYDEKPIAEEAEKRRGFERKQVNPAPPLDPADLTGGGTRRTPMNEKTGGNDTNDGEPAGEGEAKEP
eukprot:s1102_g4.t1